MNNDISRIVTCFKAVPFEDDIKVDGCTRKLKYDDAQYVVSLYDKNAIEAGMQLFEKNGGKYTALSVSDSEKLLNTRKDVLSRGPEELVAVIDKKLSGADSLVTANVLAAAVRKMGDVGIVICAEGSGDVYAQQVGPRVGQALSWPVISYATSVELSRGEATVIRKLDDRIEKIVCPLPLVITIAGDSNSPRIPSLRNIMSAGKKPFQTITTDELSIEDESLLPAVVPVKVEGKVPERKRVLIEDEIPAAVDKLVRQLVAEACLG